MPQTQTNTLLQNVAGMTRFRDHALLDVAFVQTLIGLFGKGRRRFSARLFRVTQVGEKLQFTLNARNLGEEIRFGEEDPGESSLPPQLVEAARFQAMQFTDVPCGRRAVEHCCWLPICHDGQVLACLELRRSRPLTPKQIALGSGVLALYGNYLSLLRYSETDTLTRLLNRKTFEDSLSRILATIGHAAALAPDQERRREDDSREDWLAVMDIDHFKLVNDRYGHLFGDEVLILVADEMRRVFRRFDKLFRFGGEEFVVILRHTSEKNAIRVFERFRHEIEKREFPQVGRVTISIGATRILVNDSSTTLLGRADDALYYAKKHGRNRLCLHEALVAAGDLKKPVHEMTVELF